MSYIKREYEETLDNNSKTIADFVNPDVHTQQITKGSMELFHTLNAIDAILDTLYTTICGTDVRMEQGLPEPHCLAENVELNLEAAKRIQARLEILSSRI